VARTGELIRVVYSILSSYIKVMLAGSGVTYVSVLVTNRSRRRQK
jgi:hypothetical protein